jgi:hypothetical protein
MIKYGMKRRHAEDYRELVFHNIIQDSRGPSKRRVKEW